MSDALNFRIAVDDKDLKTLNATITQVRNNLMGLGQEATKSMSSFAKSANQVESATRRASSGSKTWAQAVRMQVRTVDGAIAKNKALEASKKRLNVTDKHYATKLQLINRELERNNKFLAQYSTGQTKAATQTARTTRTMQRQAEVFQRNTSLADQFRNQIVGFTSIYGLERLLSTLIKIRGEFEIQNVALTSMLQNKALADRLFAQVQELALKSPFKILDLNRSLKQLKAYRIENTELIKTLSMLGDISAGLGVDMDRLILAFGQIRATSWLRGTELRQLTEAGINILEPLVDKFAELGEVGLSTGDIMKKIENRMISFEMVRDIFEDMTEEGGLFYQQQILQSETLKGKVSILTDAYHKMLNEIGTNNEGVLKGAVDAATSLIQSIEILTTAFLTIISTFGVYRGAIWFANGGTVTLMKNLQGMGEVMKNPIRAMRTLRTANLGLEASQRKVIATQQAASLWNAKAAASSKSLVLANNGVIASNHKVAVSATTTAAAVKKASISTAALKGAMGAISIALNLAVIGLVSYVQKQKEYSDAVKTSVEDTDKMILDLTRLNATIKDESKTLKERNDALRQAKELSPEIIKGLKAEQQTTDALTASIEKQIEALKLRADVELAYGRELNKAEAGVEAAEEALAKSGADLTAKLSKVVSAILRDPIFKDQESKFTDIFIAPDLDPYEKLFQIVTLLNKEFTGLKGTTLATRQALAEVAYEVNIPGQEGKFGVKYSAQTVKKQADDLLKAEKKYSEAIGVIFEQFRTQADAEAKSTGVSFAEEFGRIVGGSLREEDISDYIIETLFPANWETNQDKYISDYFARYRRQVTRGTDEWLDQMKDNSSAQSYAKKRFLLDLFGLGEIDDIRFEARQWAITVNKMIKEAGDKIVDFRAEDIALPNIAVATMQTSIEAYREEVAKAVEDTKSAMAGLADAAPDDPEVQRLNKLYEDRLALLKQIKIYLNILDKERPGRQDRGTAKYFKDFEELLGVLRKIKTETQRLQGELDYTLEFGFEVDKEEATRRVKSALDELFTGEGIYNAYEEVYTKFRDQTGFGELINQVFEDEDVSELDVALRKVLDGIIANITKQLKLTGKEVEGLKAKYGININELLFGEASNKEYDEFIKFRDDFLASEVVFGDDLVFNINQTSKKYTKALKEIEANYKKLVDGIEGYGLTEEQASEAQKINQALSKEQLEENRQAQIRNFKGIVDNQLGVYKQFLDNVNEATWRQMREIQEMLDTLKLPSLTDLLADTKLASAVDLNKAFEALYNSSDFDASLAEYSAQFKDMGFSDEDIAKFQSAAVSLKALNEELYKTQEAFQNLTAAEKFNRILQYTDEYAGKIGGLGRDIDEANVNSEKWQTTLAGVAKSLEVLGTTSASLFENFDTTAFQEAQDAEESFFTSFKKGMEGIETTDSFAAIADGVIQMTALIIKSINEYKSALKEFQLSQREFRSTLSVMRIESIRAEKGQFESLFIDDWESELRRGVEAAKEAQKEISRIVVQLGEEGEVVVGKGKKFSWDKALQGAGAGAAIGAGVGAIAGAGIGAVPGAVVGAGIGAVAGISAGFLGDVEDKTAALFEKYPDLVKYENGVAMINKGYAENLISTGLVKDETALWLQEAIDLTGEYEAALDQVDGVITDLTGTIAEDLKNTLVDAFVNGTYAAQDFRKSLEEVLETMIATSIFNATFGQLFQQFEEDIKNALLTPDQQDEIAAMQGLFEQANYLVPTFDALMQNASLLASQFNFDLFEQSVDELGQVSKGLQGMSEDTANILAGQFNSIRDAVWRIYNQISEGRDATNTAAALTEGVSQLVLLNGNVQTMMNTTEQIHNLFRKVTTPASGVKINL